MSNTFKVSLEICIIKENTFQMTIDYNKNSCTFLNIFKNVLDDIFEFIILCYI